MNEAMGLEALDREELIFHAAVQLRDPGKRALYLDWACEGSPELRVRIEKLLANDRGDNFFTQPLASPATLNRLPPEALSATVQEQGAGERIGRYKLLQKIGEGGCGAVYMAEQEEPVRRRVALKIIRLGMDTRSVIARFEAERQALAMMDHPNIAKILDGGVTDTGRPYFVMDLVQGLPIIQFCDEAQLPTKERLALFMEVCSAIQHAHQKGIIHRDIKPSNILVTLHGEKPVPKVIDFGIAKATQHRLTDKTVFTQFQQFIGTPAYMSPEQATLSGLDIDTRSDIYSLGVLLYELLTGKTPFESKELLQAGVDEMCRTIREKEPPTPSTRVSIMGDEEVTTTAKCRGLEAPKLLSQLRGDLDWIIMKCLEKDRARRYETANGLAMDIQRYLNNEPVVARPPSQFYRLQKLMRRNRLLFAAGGVIATVLLLGVMVSAWQAVRARRAEHEQQRLRLAALAEKNKAEREAAKSRQEARLLQDMLASVGPSKALGRDTTMLREILDKTVERIGKELAEQPEVQIELSATIADTYHELGLYRRAETLARANVAMAKTCFGEQHWAVAQALYQLGKAQLSLGNIEQSEASLRQALALRRKLFGEQNLEVAASLAQLARALDYQWKWAEGESLYRQALDLRQKLQGPEDPEVASSLHGLGLCLMRQAQPFRMSSVAETNLTGLFRRDKLNEAEACLRQSVAIKQKVLGAEHPDLASSLNVLATVLVLRGKLATAEDYYRQAWKLHRKLVGEQHPDTLLALRNLADVLRREGKSADLDEVCEQLLGMKQRLLADENPASTDPLINVGVALEEQAKFAEAEELYRRALVLRRKLGDEHPSVAQTVQGLLANLIEQNKFTEADAFLVGTVGPLLKAHQGCEPLLRARAYFLVHRGRWKEAIEDFAKAITLDPSDHMLYVSIISLLAAEGRLDEYSQYCQAVTTRFAGTQDGPTAERLAKACLILPPTARELSRACTLAEMAVKRNTHPAQCCWTSFCMGLAEYRRGRFESAETWAQQTLAQAGMLVESYGIEGEAYALLALCRCQLGRKGDARIAAAECAEVISQRAPDLNRGDPGPDWTDVLYSQTLLKQARALIRENGSAGSQGTFGVTNSEADLR